MINSFIEAIKAEERRIQRFVDLSDISRASNRGSLALQKKGQRVYAYERWQKKGCSARRKYLGKLDSTAVRELFSIRFKAQRLARLEHNQKLLLKLAQQYQPYDFNSVVDDMPLAYQAAAKANCFDQRYEELRAWAEADYPKNTYPFFESENYAADGTRLRSKGECLLYNLLQGRGILFRNDCELEIVDKNGRKKKLCPDFLIQCFDGTLIIIEHLGKMGEYGYSMDFGERCYWYFQEGFVLGKNFFVTSDDPYHGTDSHMIARIVDRIEELFYGF